MRYFVRPSVAAITLLALLLLNAAILVVGDRHRAVSRLPLSAIAFADVGLPTRCLPLASAPATCSSNTTGRCYANTGDSNNVYWCNGTSWLPMSIAGGSETLTVTDLASPNQSGAGKFDTTWTPTTVSTGLTYGVYGKDTYTGAMTQANPGHWVGGLMHAVMNAIGQTADLMVGVEGKIDNLAGTVTNAISSLAVLTSNAGTLTNWAGHYSQITTNAGTITNAYMHASLISNNAGTITNLYGNYFADMSSVAGGGTITNRWSLYNADASAPIYTQTNTLTGTTARTFNFPAGTTYSVAALTAVANNFVTGLGTDGVLTKTQPAFTNISGVVTVSQGGFGASAASIAKGGFVTGSGAGTFTITTIGGDGSLAVGNSAAAGGFSWANKVGGSGSAPTVTSCGSSPTTVTGNDFKGRLTTGSGGTVQSCTLTFSAAFLGTPSCIANSETSILAVRATATTTTLVIDSAVAGTLASDTINYICAGN